MTPPSSSSRRLAIVGGGITGLAAAWRARQLDPTVELVVLESRDRPGGVLSTIRKGGFLIEQGADNFIVDPRNPWAFELCRDLGNVGEVLPTDERYRQVFVVRDGKLMPVPAGFILMVPERIGPILRSPLLSLRGKLRLLAEYFVPAKKTEGDESLASFVRRRFGREVFDRLVQPLIGGIYTADPEKLSLAATMPRFLELERKAGGLIRGRRLLARRPDALTDPAASGARYSMFCAPKAGLSSLIDALAASLPAGALHLGTTADSLTRLPDGRWQIVWSGGKDQLPQTWSGDGVILAIPAPAAGRLLEPTSAPLAAELGAIEYAEAVVISLGFRRDQIAHPLGGFGVVVPATEGRSILAVSFSSVKFAGRAPDSHVLMRVFVGGACQPELARLGDEPMLRMVLGELQELLGVTGEPVVVDIARWPGSMAQYHLGHVERIARIESLVADLPGVALAGNAYHGVGIAQCIHSGSQAAEKVLAAC